MVFIDDNKDIALLQLKLLGEYRPAIFKEYLSHAPNTGYVFISAEISDDDTLTAVEQPRFINREVDKSKFVNFLEWHSLSEEQPAALSHDHETVWVYYEVHWLHSRSSWYLKEPVDPALDIIAD